MAISSLTLHHLVVLPSPLVVVQASPDENVVEDDVVDVVAPSVDLCEYFLAAAQTSRVERQPCLAAPTIRFSPRFGNEFSFPNAEEVLQNLHYDLRCLWRAVERSPSFLAKARVNYTGCRLLFSRPSRT